MKVLIIDTEPRRQRQLRTILSALGHRATEIESASDIDSGLQSIRAKRCDVCFLSVDCRDYDALARLAEIRSGLATKSVPVIAVSAHPVKEHILRLVRAGASAFLAYPFTAGDVEAAIAFALP